MRLATGWGAGVTFALVFLLLQRIVPLYVWAAFSLRSVVLELLGVLILIVATAFTLWARWDLGTMWSATPSIKQAHELRTDGAYRITRHPIYTGLLVMLFATMLISGFGAAVIGFVLFCIYLAIKIRTEEQMLIQTFGERYEQYRRAVPGLIPSLGR